jgi:hypothetical protein
MAEISDKWGDRVAARGFAQLPNYLVQLNQFLGDDNLSPIELLVLIQLSATWWKKDDLPFPSVATLAARCGVSGRQVQRALNRLEELKLIQRVRRRIRGIISSNAYDLAPLVAFLDDLAKVYPNAYPRRGGAGTDAPTQGLGVSSEATAPARPKGPRRTGKGAVSPVADN